MFNTVKCDCGSITGHNILRMIMLATNHNVYNKAEKGFHMKPAPKYWCIPIIKEMMAVKLGDTMVTGFKSEELEAILTNACCN